MARPGPLESRNVSLLAAHDLDGRPPFKIAVAEVDGSWYLYLAHFWHSGWSVVDVTDPRAPELVRFVEGPTNTMTLQVQVADGLMVTSLERPRPGVGPVDGPRMDPARPYETGVYVFDLADPTDPERIAHWDPGGRGTHRNHYHGGDYLYATNKPAGFDGAVLDIVDVSDPAEPARVGRWWHPGQAPDEDATHRYYLHGPAYPDADEDRAYLSYGSVGMVVLDIADKTAPERVSTVSFGDLGSWLAVHSAVPLPGTDFVVVNSEAIEEASPLTGGDPLNFTMVVDVTEDGDPRFDGTAPRGPKVVSAFELPRPSDALAEASYYDRAGKFGPHNQHHYQYRDDHARLTDLVPMTYFNAGLRLFDVSDVRHPTEVGHFLPTDPPTQVNDRRPATGLVSQFEDVLVDARGVIYCSDPNHGLFVLESPLV